MSYDLRYAFGGQQGMTLHAVRLNDSGEQLGDASVLSSFDADGNYGFTVRHSDGESGFLAFMQDATCIALFSVNPQEGENLDIKVSSIGEPGGAGAVQYPFTSNDVNGNPIQGVSVWVSSDTNGLDVVAGTLLTDKDGSVTFMLDHGTWYIWQFHHSYMFTPNPVKITV